MNKPEGLKSSTITEFAMPGAGATIPVIRIFVPPTAGAGYVAALGCAVTVVPVSDANEMKGAETAKIKAISTTVTTIGDMFKLHLHFQ